MPYASVAAHPPSGKSLLRKEREMRLKSCEADNQNVSLASFFHQHLLYFVILTSGNASQGA